MVRLTPRETQLTDDVLACLADTIRRTEGVELAYANKIKIQKLLYLARDEFGLPITYSWYLAGSVVPDGNISPSTVASFMPDQQQPDEPSIPDSSPTVRSDVGSDFSETTEDRGRSHRPTEADESDSQPLDPVLFPDIPTDCSDRDRPGDLTEYVSDRRDVVAFFERVLPDVWHQQTMRFLQNFYDEHAPEPYRSLYLTSAHIRTHLLDAEDAVAAALDGEEPSRSLAEISQALGLDISDFHCYIKRDPDLAETFDTVVDGTALIEDAFLCLEQLDPDSLTAAHRDALTALQEFFYYTVWRHPCLIISRETASGPQARELREEREAMLSQFDELAAQSHAELRETLARAGLLPDPHDVSLPDDELTDSLAALTRGYLDQ
jgi:hypothetical protein